MTLVYQERISEYENDISRLKNHQNDDEIYFEVIQKYGLQGKKKNPSVTRVISLLGNEKKKYQELLDETQREKETFGNANIVHSDKTYSGVEIAHLCKNENKAADWKLYGFPNNKKLIDVIFYFFILPKIEELAEIAGCEYAYLFAADKSEDNILISAYEMLGFKRNHSLGTVKERFDFFSDFMCRKVEELQSGKVQYYENFNEDDTSFIPDECDF